MITLQEFFSHIKSALCLNYKYLYFWTIINEEKVIVIQNRLLFFARYSLSALCVQFSSNSNPFWLMFAVVAIEVE